MVVLYILSLFIFYNYFCCYSVENEIIFIDIIGNNFYYIYVFFFFGLFGLMFFFFEIVNCFELLGIFDGRMEDD